MAIALWGKRPPFALSRESSRCSESKLHREIASVTIARVTAGRRGHALFASCPGIPGRVISVVFASKYPQKSRSFRGGSRFLATPSSSVTRVFPVPALGCSGSAHALRFQLPFRQNRFATDSALEGIGFEPSVPPSSIGHPDVLHRFPNGSRGNWHTAGNQLSVGCTSYADQDQPDSLQNIRSPTPG